MGNFNRPEGQTTSDNFLKSEIEKDFLRAQSGWGELSEEELAYLGKKGLKTPADLLRSYRELERAYSSKVSLPKDGDKKGFDKLYSRLGMPHDCTGFDICFAAEDREDGEAFKQVCLETISCRSRRRLCMTGMSNTATNFWSAMNRPGRKIRSASLRK